MRAVYAASLAQRGFTGPKGLFEGPYGLELMFAQPIPVNWEDPSLEVITQTVMKRYCSLIHGQPVLEAVLDLKRRNSSTAADVEEVRCDVFQGAFEFRGRWRLRCQGLSTGERAGDYNLRYLIAAALLDDQLGPAQLEEARIQAPDAQALPMRVEIRPDERFSARYPHELSARVTIRTKDQRVFVKEENGYEGGLTNPMCWERTVDKFDWLAEAFADEELRGGIIGAVERLDTSELSDLTDLLAQVQPIAMFPITHPGIQCPFVLPCGSGNGNGHFLCLGPEFEPPRFSTGGQRFTGQRGHLLAPD
ncbi:MAG TPA: hypothetical protein VNU92_02245 [Edaphobacter sp.]|jgi:2-methylcitrate dehydratase|nr:hypothetical protein [Edaphobacter sp.]